MFKNALCKLFLLFSISILHTERTMIAKTAGNCCEGNICACAEEKEYHDICLEQLSLSY